MQDNQDSLDLDVQKKIPTEGIETVKIRVSVFFDGTLNNRTNINQRLLASPDEELTQEERKAAAELEQKTSEKDKQQATELYQKYGAKKEGQDNSYEGYYTNVSIMETYIDPTPDSEYALRLQTYIEGAGSLDKAKDQKSGYAFAIWESGIPAKVSKGLNNVITLIKEGLTKKSIVIEEVRLDLFGFSRGAAAARNFIHEALYGEQAIKTQLVDILGYKVQPKAVKVCFVGLYDTVASYGVLKTALDLGVSNTDTLKLFATAYAERVVQLAAADEHRQYFSLTNIESARSKGLEIFLPGVHSDIGGGYRNNQTEKQQIYENYGYSLDDARQEVRDLIASGFYRENEIFLEHTPGYDGDESDESSVIKVERRNISNLYSRIPLNLMTGYAREQNVKLTDKLDDNESVPDELADIKKRIDHYIATTQTSRAQHWHQNTQAWLRELRHKYLHFSARCVLGHTPRYYEGKRARLTIVG